MSDQDENNNFEKNRIKWEFFKLHANQRLTFFRFYIGLLVALFVAYFYLYDHLKDCQGTLFLYICLILAGLGVSVISSMFYLIDSRNVELIDNAKKALNEIDELSHNSTRMVFRHKGIFKYVFGVTFTVGIFLFSLGFFKLYSDNQCPPFSSQAGSSNKCDDKCVYPKDDKTKSPNTERKPQVGGANENRSKVRVYMDTKLPR